MSLCRDGHKRTVWAFGDSEGPLSGILKIHFETCGLTLGTATLPEAAPDKPGNISGRKPECTHSYALET